MKNKDSYQIPDSIKNKTQEIQKNFNTTDFNIFNAGKKALENLNNEKDKDKS
ncbi:hypothetical protein OTSUT76_3113 [Orientia tsutsugamushi str. UT76]|nr:hypothetical protein OTSUT76_3113 [Orientia tsutsugamushi str. UT76]